MSDVYDPTADEFEGDRTDPDALALPKGDFAELGPTSAAAALDGPVPEGDSGVIDGPIPAAVEFSSETTAKLNIDPALMPEVVKVIEDRCKDERTMAIGAMVDAMLMDGVIEIVALRCAGKAIKLIEERKRERLLAPL